MPLLKITVHFFPTLALSIFVSLCLAAQSSPSRGPAGNPETDSERIHRIETSTIDIPLGDNEQRLRLNLEKVMQLYKVPGLSIAVINDFHIIWAKAYGVIEAGSTVPVTTRTLFQAGSISKPVAATGALYLVERGKLVLDEDVNQKLKTWKVPENEFTKTENVTLRRLMSHSGGLTVHGFPGYDVNEPMPTMIQILNGQKPANTAAIRVDSIPGTRVRYSGGGVTIEQQLIIDVTGKSFPAFMRENVLDRIGMTDSSYEQPLSPARAGLTAAGTYADGRKVHGRWHLYPEMAAAGLWTTPTDLSKFAIEIALSKNGKSNRVLSEKTAREMLTAVMDDAALGFFLDNENPGQFGHNGADEGFQALLTMNADSGNGVAIMANSDNGIAVGDFLLQSVAKEYGWSYRSHEPGAFQTLALLARLKGAQAALQRYTELKKSGLATQHVEEGTLNGLGYTLLFSGQTLDAIAVFQSNVQEYPNSANVYDSLGEAYMKSGQKELAIQNYQKSLQLDSKNQNAIEILKKLKETK
jgi:CubicO group peptidase (beta-lactamase class C family)